MPTDFRSGYSKLSGDESDRRRAAGYEKAAYNLPIKKPTTIATEPPANVNVGSIGYEPYEWALMKQQGSRKK